MDVAFEFDGEVVERQELLNGTQSITVEGMSTDRQWSVNFSVSWNLRILDFSGEGDITLVGPEGIEVFGGLITATAGAGRQSDWTISAAFDIDGGSDEWETAQGRAEVSLEISVTTATGTAVANLMKT